MLLGPFKITVFRLAQLANVQKSIFFIPAGISTDVISVLLKALAPSFVNAEGNMTEVSPFTDFCDSVWNGDSCQ